MSLLLPNVGEIEVLRKALFGRGGTITGVTNAAPAVITSNAHGLANGNSVNISDVGGTTAVNGSNLTVYNVATNTFQVMTVATTVTGTAINGNGAYTSGGTWSLGGVENLQLKLFSSSTTPAETDVAGTYTVLTPGSGYAVQTLTSKLSAVTGWAAPASVAPTGAWSGEALVAEATAPQIVYSFTGAFTVNGYIVVGADSTTLYWAENFGSTKNISSGDSLTMTPRFGMS
jgi:hypothetical protein